MTRWALNHQTRHSLALLGLYQSFSASACCFWYNCCRRLWTSRQYDSRNFESSFLDKATGRGLAALSILLTFGALDGSFVVRYRFTIVIHLLLSENFSYHSGSVSWICLHVELTKRLLTAWTASPVQETDGNSSQQSDQPASSANEAPFRPEVAVHIPIWPPGRHPILCSNCVQPLHLV